MLVAHGVWHGGALCLWAEHDGERGSGGGAHPFATRDFSGTALEGRVRGAARVTLEMLLPSVDGAPLPSAELGAVPHPGEPVLAAWQVPALVLDPFAAMGVLSAPFWRRPDTPAEDRAEENDTEDETTRTEQDGTEQGSMGQGGAEQGSAEQDGAGQASAAQGGAEQDGAGLGGAGQASAAQGGAGQGGAEQSSAGQSSTGRGSAEQGSAGRGGTGQGGTEDEAPRREQRGIKRGGGGQGGGGVVAGSDLRFLAVVAEDALELARRGRVLPALREEDRDVVAHWRAVADPGRLARLAAAMPAACRAAVPGLPAARVLAEALDGLVDTAVRAAAPYPLLPARTGKAPERIPLAERWAEALTGPSGLVVREPGDDPAELRAELDAWFRAARPADGLLKLTFRLLEPAAEEGPEDEPQDTAVVEPRPDAPWRVEFLVQGTEDPSLLVSAAQIWAGEAFLEGAEETLLAGLGRALRVFPDLAPALDSPVPAELPVDVAGAFRFLRTAAPLLAAAGFGVLLPTWAGREKLGLKLRTEDPAADGDGAAAKSGFGLGDLVEFRWEVAVGEETIAEDDLAELARLKTPLVRLRGRWVELDPEQLDTALDFLRHGGSGAMTAGQVVRAVIHAGEQSLPLVSVEAAGALGDLLSGEADRRITPVPTPEGITATLRPYQQRGLAWLSFMEDLGLGALLADDMGLGKTLTILSHLARTTEPTPHSPGGTVGKGGPTLVVVPMSLVGTWRREAGRFAPKLRVHVHHGAGRHKDTEGFVAAALAADLVLTTYGTAARDVERLAAVGWARVVCDEAQALKNSSTRQAKAVRSIPARSRIALTGTPVENHLGELWSVMEFANPGLLGPKQAFRERFAAPIEAEGDEAAAAALQRATRPFILRRLKTDKSIISDLPEKQEMKVYCTLTVEQASLYQATVEDMLERIAEADARKRRGLVLATMARLKQVCDHPALLLKDGSRLQGRSGKLERLEELCGQILDADEKVLVFTQYAEFGTMLQPYLETRLDRPVLWLHGGTSRDKRDAMVQRFQGEEGPSVFLLSLKAAGTGLTLTAANHVVHYDRWWNPAVEDQATDRAFRIGQTRDVQVRKFVCAGTMEERVDEMIERKKALAEAVVGTGEDWLGELSVAELREVLTLSPDAVGG
ncbi:DEAD/DEAH box helicase [Actinocorallia sp. A-T 12471]|uniref:DEAD/DEAH box helicase n=1 Tax=Actinocorallia sp. A-T 12471 TaxID=3089813 RepID=UPI0029CFCC5D|nr:DEAD/DEAH box helicase [Actinocorallia sp. A-T 12471]MDX6738988.1 DEAD/DEAH box helicase [Actinocorallia sp. A-T 12471]